MSPDKQSTNQNKTLGKGLLLDLILIVGILLLVFGGLVYYQNNVNTIYTSNSDYVNTGSKVDYDDLNRINLEKKQLIEQKNIFVEITIPEGVSSFEVAQILEENNIIQADEFLGLVEMFDLEKKIKAGNYYLKRKTSLVDLIKKIT